MHISATEISKKLTRIVGYHLAKLWTDPRSCRVANVSYRITDAGVNLPYRYVAHLIIKSLSVSKGYDQIVAKDLMDIFVAVDQLEQRSIAISAIGTGELLIYRFSIEINSTKYHLKVI